MAAPGRAIGDVGVRQRVPVLGGQRLPEGHHVEATVDGRVHEPLEEQVAELLVVAVQLAVGGDRPRGVSPPASSTSCPGGAGSRCAAGPSRGRSGRRRPSPRAGRRRPRTGPRRRRPRRATARRPGRRGEGRRVSSAAVDCLPRRQHRPADALLGEGPQGRLVHGRLGQPEAGRRMAEPELGSRGCPSGSRSADRAAEASGRMAWWKAWARAFSGCGGDGDPREDVRSVGCQEAREGGADVEGDPVEVAALGVRPVALRRDAVVPARDRAPRSGRGASARRTGRAAQAGRSGRGSRGGRGSSAVPARPSSAARSRVVVTVCSTRTVVAAPAGRTSGQAKTSAEPW